MWNNGNLGMGGDDTPPYAMTKEERLSQLIVNMKFPPTCRTNTPKEALCLDFIEHFRSQYVELFPTRPPLLLNPENECGTRKVICTFLKPVTLPFNELYDYQTCAKYIANYITYEQLADPERLPSTVVSPTTTLQWQIGDCFDIALLVVSLLLGCGYDAYVVIGYAKKDITTNDHSHAKCPVVLPNTNEKAETAVQETKVTKYILRKRPPLLSKFEQQKEEKRRLEEEAALRQQDGEGEEGQEQEQLDELHGRRVHCWVLVQYGKRDVQRSFFIEPSTGEQVSLDDPCYLRIESVFNNENYWINMQRTESVRSIKDLDFELRDLAKWEYVFLKDTEADDEDAEAQDRKHLEELTSDAGEAGDQILDLPASWVEKMNLTLQQYENRYPGLQKTVEYKDAILELFAPYSQKDLKVQCITYIDESRTPTERHTLFAHRTDKLKRRSEHFPTGQRNRVIYEWFDEGRRRDQNIEALKEHIMEEGKQREFRFYSDARLDGLSKRLEIYHEVPEGSAVPTYPRKVVEYFEDRENRLIYRSATYEPPNPVPGVTVSGPGTSGQPRGFEDSKPNPKKMTERFARNEALPADQDVARRTFYNPTTPEGQVKVLFHSAEGKVTRPSRVYTKGQPVTVENVDVFAKQPKAATLAEEMRMLFQKEKECLMHVRDSEKEAKGILEERKKEEENVEASISVYDTLRKRLKEDEQSEVRRKLEEQQRASNRKDYLAPYIEQFVRSHQRPGMSRAVPTNISEIRLEREEAQKVKEACLKELKDRLIQRAHIMQNRLDAEKEALARRQANFQKQQEQIDQREHEEYITYCEEAMWRIHILEKRLERHQEQSFHRYAELDAKLRSDHRLAALA